jgi:molecular chaperone GrpE
MADAEIKPDNLNEDSAEFEVEKLRTDLEEAGDRLLRAQAELDNYRKRARRELEDSLQYATMPLLRDLLPVIDNLGRALAVAEKSGE